MAFNTAPGRAEYTASAAQTKFTFAFKIYNTSDVKVYLTPVDQAYNDATDILIETTDYTVSINGDNGGDVTLTSGATLNDRITLARSLPADRDVEYQQNGDLTAEALNEDQDYQTYLILDGVLIKERALIFQDSVQNVSSELPSPDPTKVLGWNIFGSALENYTVGTDDVFINILNVDNVTDLIAVSTLTYATVNVLGYYSPNDGGGGIFNYDSSQSTVNNGITIINGWVRQAYQKEDSGTTTTYQIPTDFADLQKALDIISEKKFPSGAKVNVNIETGHALTVGFRVENIDLSFVTITSDDATVTLDASFQKQSTFDLDSGIARSDAIGFLGIRAKMPVFDILVDLSGVDITQGIAAVIDSSISVLPAKGVINAAHSIHNNGANIYAAGSSRAYGSSGNFSGAELNGCQISVNSFAQFALADFSGSSRTGIDVSRGSVVYANEANVSSCDRGIDCRRSWLVAQGTNFDNCVTLFLWARIGSHVIIDLSSLEGATPALKKILIEQGSFVSANGTTGLAGAPLARSEVSGGIFNTMNKNGIIVNDSFEDYSGRPLIAGDTITQGNGDQLAVGALAYSTLVDLTGQFELLSGSIFSVDAGMRITIDGEVIVDKTARTTGDTSAPSSFSVVNIPPCISTSTLKVEAYNRSSVSRDFGWNLIYRVLV